MKRCCVNRKGKKVLITDGTYKNSLAVLRSLGRKGYDIDIVTAHSKFISVCFYSKYRGKVLKIKSPLSDIDRYAEELMDVIKREKYDFFIPVGLQSCIAASKYRKEFEGLTGVLLPEWRYMEIAASKDKSVEFAQKLDIPVPHTYILDSESDLDKIEDFPVVIKTSDEASKFIRYCNNRTELIENFSNFKRVAKTRIIAQEYIKGFGCGFYAVYKEGELKTYFLHRRLKEFPITGGPSVVAESYFDKKLYKYGKKLCDALRWNGPIMVEFKYDIDSDDYKLIEVNPKLWGSLDLTIEAGIDVPQIIVDLIMGKEVYPVKYSHVKFRWVFPDELKALASNFSLSGLIDFLCIDKKIKTNIRLDDFGPVIFQFLEGIVESLEIIVDKRKAYPHGRIVI